MSRNCQTILRLLLDIVVEVFGQLKKSMWGFFLLMMIEWFILPGGLRGTAGSRIESNSMDAVRSRWRIYLEFSVLFPMGLLQVQRTILKIENQTEFYRRYPVIWNRLYPVDCHQLKRENKMIHSTIFFQEKPIDWMLVKYAGVFLYEREREHRDACQSNVKKTQGSFEGEEQKRQRACLDIEIEPGSLLSLSSTDCVSSWPSPSESGWVFPSPSAESSGSPIVTIRKSTRILK